jgi:antitoxin (DNA-binding transcriptional repressor) of toxin-antitoxin stability system
MSQVQLREEEEQFAAAVSEAQAGRSVEVLLNGKPVAEVIPFRGASAKPTGDAWERLTRLMDQGVDLGGVWNGRDELYDRD